MAPTETSDVSIQVVASMNDSNVVEILECSAANSSEVLVQLSSVVDAIRIQVSLNPLEKERSQPILSRLVRRDNFLRDCCSWTTFCLSCDSTSSSEDRISMYFCSDYASVMVTVVPNVSKPTLPARPLSMS